MNPKKCASCSALFTPDRMGQKACSPKCAWQAVEAKKQKAFNAETRRRKKELLDNDKAHWKEKAREACHSYIRARDAHLPCVSCGTTENVQYAAGHYRPSGVNGALRYDERNIHKQCNRNCNSGLSGNLTEYRKTLIDRLGADVVEWLDGNHEVKRWTLDELKAITKHYKAKLKEIT